jgi:hypothetical protein
MTLCTLKIPNTSNAFEGYFAHLENKLKTTMGYEDQEKQKLIDAF